MPATQGYQRILKIYGRMKFGDVWWVWDYVKDEPVREAEMKRDPERAKLSEQARFAK
jgi:hypothetical protein